MLQEEQGDRAGDYAISKPRLQGLYGGLDAKHSQEKNLRKAKTY